jgi:hypothetical protein
LPLKPGGIGQYFTPTGRMTEVATSTCAHCSSITDIPDPKKLHEHTDVCRLCMRLICLKCAGKPCIPWMKRVEQAEEKAYRSQQFAKMLGF